MYIVRDDVSPRLDSHANALAFKNTMLRHWPRNNWGNGVETFGLMIVSVTGIGVLKDNAHLRVYSKLGMKVKDLESQSLDGIDFTYMYIASYNATNGVILAGDIRSYIMEYTPLVYPLHKNVFNQSELDSTDMNPDPNKGTSSAYWDKDGWIKVLMKYTPTKIDLIEDGLTDEQIIAKARATSYNEVFFDPTLCNRLTAVALLDIDHRIFESTIRITSRSIVKKDKIMSANNINQSIGVTVEQVRYLESATIELKFRRTTDVAGSVVLGQEVNAFLDSVKSIVDSLSTQDDVDSKFSSPSWINKSRGIDGVGETTRIANSGYSRQLVAMANWVNPYEDNEMTLVADGSVTNGYFISNVSTEIKVSGLIDLPPKEFMTQFVKLLKFDQKVHEDAGHWYDAVVSIVIVIVAVVLAYVSYGAGYGLIASAGILSGGALALTGWSMYLAKNGGGAKGMRLAGRLSEYLGIAAMIVGIVAIYQSWAQAIQQEAAAEAAASQTAEMAASGMTASDMAFAGATTEIVTATAQSSVQLAMQGVSAVADLGGELGLLDEDTASYISMATGAYNGIASIGVSNIDIKSIQSVSLDSIVDNIAAGVTKFVKQPLSAIMNKVVNWINMGFNAYMKLVQPDNEGIADKKALLEILEKEVESTSPSPDNIEDTWKIVQDPYNSIYELTDKLGMVSELMTQGQITNMMSKHYLGWK